MGGSLYNQYSDNVVAGGGFIEVADSFADFGPVIQRKLIREISNDVPAPA